MTEMPAIVLTAVPGRRAATLELALEIERRGFAGIYCASFGDAMGFCVSMAHATTTIPFGTAIANIYTRHPREMAGAAAYLHEVSGGRFRMGLGVSHAPTNSMLGVHTGKPLADMRQYVATMRETPRTGELPPIVLATLRRKMVELSAEIGQGAVWANAARSHMADSLSHVAKEKLDGGFFVGNSVNICVNDDEDVARQVVQRAISGYLNLPNYRNYWREAGYGEEIDGVEAAIARGETSNLPGLMSDKWLRDTTIFGSAKKLRDEIDAWRAAGVSTPIMVPASANGGQMVAYAEVFAALE